MFSCSACFRRTLRALLSDLPPIHPSPTRHRGFPCSISPSSRKHSTLQAIRKGHHQRVLRNALAKKNENTSDRNIKRRKGPLPGEVRDVLARENNRQHLALENNSVTGKTRFELQWLQDPLKLANAVMERLRIGDDQAALELIRGSEKTIYADGRKQGGQVDNVVSWNHVVDYYMHKGDTREALKVYNEMKKRGQRPEAHTYTLLLSGFAKNIKKPNAVANAVSVYNSIFAPNSVVKPNTIHTNAVINVCARGGDMDNLWAIAGRLPERGPGSADAITYTNILNALRADAELRSRQEGLSQAVSQDILDRAIRNGEKLWLDINKRWQNQDLILDERLICAMGRLLLLGRGPEQWTSVFTLVEQTMRVPRFKDGQQIDSRTDFSATESEAESKSDHETSNSGVGFSPFTVYAKPANNTLSMLLQACILTKNLGAGKYYWKMLTLANDNHRVSYDSENLAQYLRLLRISRSSTLAHELFMQMSKDKQADQFFMRGNFIIAMSTCVRDKNNPNVFDYATDIFKLMEDKLHGVDAKVMEMYLEIASATTPGLGYKVGKLDVNSATSNIMSVLLRYETLLPEIQEMITSKLREEQYDSISSKRRKKLQNPHDDPDRTYQDKNALFDLLKAMVSIYDRLLSHETIPESVRRKCMVQKSRLTTFITKLAPEMMPKRRERMAMYSERESGATELATQEERLISRARGIRGGPKKPHAFPPQRRRDEDRFPNRDVNVVTQHTHNSDDADRTNFHIQSRGWESGFASMEEQDSNRSKDFVSL